MQQRRLRLGDILDDYCPRERRITNHVIVAMVDEDVKQTRCSTCDAEHEYKQAKAPAPRRKKTGVLVHEVLEGAHPRGVSAPPADASDDALVADALAQDNGDMANTASAVQVEPALAASSAAPDAPGDDAEAALDERQRDDDGPVHRRLIRATLPRPEGHVPERKEPEFTMRQPTGRGEFDGNRNGHRGRHRMRQAQGQHSGGQTRFGGQRQGGGPPRHGSGAGQGQGQRQQGNRPGQPSSHRGGGRPAGQQRGPGRKRGR